MGGLPTTVMFANVTRGEIIDEEPMLAPLDVGKLGRVALDVYIGEFERQPDRRLWND